MHRFSVAALLAATVIGSAAVPAGADDPTGRCRLVAEEVAGNGQSSDTVLDAVVVGHVAEPLHVACELRINGSTVAYAQQSGTGAVAIAERVTFAAYDGDLVEVCSAITTSHGTSSSCHQPEVAFPTFSSAVVGYVSITNTGSTGPVFTPSGALSDPNLWTCTDSNTVSAYEVTCVPAAVQPVTWRCDVLHADVQTASATASARTSLDCDGGGPEASTAIVSGLGGYDSVLATSTVVVSEFTCTVDRGGLAATPDYHAGCGDPGAPRVE